MEERNMDEDQTLRFYSDDQWWDSQDLDEMQLQNYQIAATHGLDHDHVDRGAAKPLSFVPQYRQPARYPVSSSSISRDNSTTSPIQVIGPARPKRRRGRGCTMAATTFLNSTITNFRELVQQHTGMSNTQPPPPPPPPPCYYASCDRKGPITLSFAGYSYSSSTSESALGFNHRNQ